MKIITLILALVLMATTACAQFLVCDPSASPINMVQVEVVKSGVTTIYDGIYVVVGSDARILDVTAFTNGAYVFRARWADASGWWSDWSDPLNAVKSGKPGNFRIK